MVNWEMFNIKTVHPFTIFFAGILVIIGNSLYSLSNGEYLMALASFMLTLEAFVFGYFFKSSVDYHKNLENDN